MLEEKLEQEVSNYYLKSLRGDCNRIIAHPKTLKELIEELCIKYAVVIDSSKENKEIVYYKGIKILRSEDIKEGEFEVW